jgi:hypothetical protein
LTDHRTNNLLTICEVMSPLKVRRGGGEVTELERGALVELPVNEAERLARAGRVRPYPDRCIECAFRDDCGHMLTPEMCEQRKRWAYEEKHEF